MRSSSTPAQPPSRRARGRDILHRQDCTIFYDILHDILRAAAQHVYVCNRGDTRRYSCMHIHNKCTKIFECIDGVYMHCLRRGGSSPPRPRRPRLPDDSVYILLYYYILNKFIYIHTHNILYVAFERQTRSTTTRLNKTFTCNITIFIILYYIILYLMGAVLVSCIGAEDEVDVINTILIIILIHSSHNHIDSYFHIGAEDEVYVIYD